MPIGKCFSSLFYFCSYGNGVSKTIVNLTEIGDAFLTFYFLKYLLKLTGNTEIFYRRMTWSYFFVFGLKCSAVFC